MDDLEKLRFAIHALDERMVEILAVRGRLVLRAGYIKKRRGLPLRNGEVEEEKIRLLKTLANGRMDEKCIEEIWGRIFEWATKIQTQEENNQSVGWGG